MFKQIKIIYRKLIINKGYLFYLLNIFNLYKQIHFKAKNIFKLTKIN